MADPEGPGGGPAVDETHRGGFGEFGGESGGLIDRTFRERIVLVGVTHPGEEFCIVIGGVVEFRIGDDCACAGCCR